MTNTAEDIQIPMSEEVREALLATEGRATRTVFFVTALFLVGNVVYGMAMGHAKEGTVSGLFALLIGFTYTRHYRSRVIRDLEAGTVVRWSGPVDVTSRTMMIRRLASPGGLKKPAETVFAIPGHAAKAIGLGTTKVTLEYAALSKILLRLHDQHGVLLFRHPRLTS